MLKNLFVFIFFHFTFHSYGQWNVDTSYIPVVDNPSYLAGKGSLIIIDEAHNNPVLEGGVYHPLQLLLEADGYRIETNKVQISEEILNSCNIYMIINALGKSNINNWSNPVSPALSVIEIKALIEWIENGGSLFLAADHMPFPEAIKDLALRLGIEFSNGFAIDTLTWGATMFYRDQNNLTQHAITSGARNEEIIDSIATYWGQGFRVLNEKADGIMSFGSGVISYYPDTAWRFPPGTPEISMQDWWQGAAVEYGKGHVMVLGESGMLTAQVSANGQSKIGLNSKNGSQNAQFILNILHWLDGSLK